MSPSPASPWHFAQAPRTSPRRASDVPSSCALGLLPRATASNSSRGSASTSARHRGVLDSAELRALAAVDTGRLGVEPRLVRDARDRVELAAERGDPPRVDHVEVRRGDLEPDGPADGRAQLVDRDHAVRVREVPVEAVALHLHVDAGRPGRSRSERPRCRAACRRRTRRSRRGSSTGATVQASSRFVLPCTWAPSSRARPAAPPVADDEPEQRALRRAGRSRR